ncbi:MATE family efflux transporter [Deinococcus radiophilus]|uniref:Multidrug-efflux transporter n=1 Tax=Deinococcus radiophilus TaxID=32062 RepID=A0A3S0I5P3_9DEIO|nr:MATE family efflux transporter [Deinococcus radiophilus]RTR28035.1 MATE family efflux transporter [Deinococcus radiophilus]UFA51511.1 MATE family efflux transporter [Deinococcus radiophilus]
MSQPHPDQSVPQLVGHSQNPGTRTELLALVRLAGPVVLSQFAANALALVSTAVIGRIGQAELAAAAYGSALYYLFFVALSGVMLAVAPRAAAAHGSGDPQGVSRALHAGFRLALGLAAVALPVIYLLSTQLWRFAPAELDTGLVAVYLRIYALGMLPVLLFTALRGAMEATGRPALVTAIAALGVVSVVLVSPALSFGWGPLPTLGLAGAAAASALAGWLMFLGLLPLVLRRVAPLAAHTPIWPEVRSLFSLGWPIGLTLGAEAGMFSVTSLLMGQFGNQALAAHNVAFQIITALFMIPLGLSTATSIRVAQSVGAGRPGLARRAGLLGIGLAAGVMLLFAVLEVLMPERFIGVFVDAAAPANAGLVATAGGLLAIAALFQVVDGVQVSANASLRGLQDTRVPLLLSLTSFWGLGMPAGYVMAFVLDWGPRGLWYGLLVGLVAAAVMQLTRFLRLTARLRSSNVQSATLDA